MIARRGDRAIARVRMSTLELCAHIPTRVQPAILQQSEARPSRPHTQGIEAGRPAWQCRRPAAPAGRSRT